MAEVDDAAVTADLRSYFTKTFEDKLLAQHGAYDSASMTQATRMLEKRREVAELDHALTQHKEEFHMKMETLQHRKAELKTKEEQLAESLQKFDKFVKENDARKKRAMLKAEEESKAIAKIDQQIKDLEAQVAQLTKHSAAQRAQIANLVHFEHFLTQVLRNSTDFAETADLMSRHATLRVTHTELQQREVDNSARTDALQAKMARAREHHQIDVLSSTNRLASLQKDLEKAKTDAQYWESVYAQNQSGATKRTLMLGQMKMAIANLHALVEKQNKRAVSASSAVKAGDLPGLLDKVAVFLLDLQYILAAYEAGEIESVLAPSP